MTDRPTEDEIVDRVIADLRQTFGDEPVPVKVVQVARVAISGYRAGLRAAGLVVVPVEPTEAMKQAGFEPVVRTGKVRTDDIYRVMIAAALPAPPATGGEDNG